MNNKIVIGIVIGLIAGLVLGVFIGIMFISPSSKTVAETNNQVQVSGSIQEQNPIEISFSSIYGSSQTIQTSSVITNGQYSVLLIGDQSYSVIVTYETALFPYYSANMSYSLYVPPHVTTYTANF